jgi:uncharacterized protein YbaP (TraB family)
MKRYLLLAAGLLAATPQYAQTTVATPNAAASPHTLLWKITGKGVARPSYLFGTMHILCADNAALGDSLKAAIGSVDEVYFEINLGDMSDMIGAIGYMRMNDGKKLSDLLTPAEYQRVRAYFGTHQSMVPFGMLERFKPMLISGLIEEQGLGCETTDGMEMQIMKELGAQQSVLGLPQGKTKKPIRGLETAAFQASLFDSIPYEKQAKELIDDIDSVDQNKKNTQALADLYLQQDLDGIEALSDKDDPEMKGYMDLILYDRNRKWAKALDTLLPRKSLLIAVGAGHLPGGQGVIQLLRKEGFTVEPVVNKFGKGGNVAYTISAPNQ